MSDQQPLWAPTTQMVETAAVTEFARLCGERFGVDLAKYDDLHAWSVSDREHFWSAVWDFCDIRGHKGQAILENGDAMPGARFFPEARLNFAENLLAGKGDGDALVFRGEDKVQYRLSWDELRALVSRLQQAMRSLGIGSGDRVAAMMPNLPETIAAMLAATSLGAIWSSCSPDFGDKGVLDRFGQIEPKLFIACDGYWYNGKKQDVSEKLKTVEAELKPLKTVIVPYAGDAETLVASLENAATLESFIEPFNASDITFEQLPFEHPVYIMFSSGTTGIPKCIVHSAGGTLLQHVKEQRLHCGMQAGDRVFYFTTCGWMMWNWLVSALACEATLCLFDGSPFYPDGNVLFDYAAEEKITFFGTSAKYIDAVRKDGLTPKTTHDLSQLRMITSTGSPLSPE